MLRSWRKWLCPGIGVKRWLLLLMVGLTSVSLGLGFVLVAIYRQQPLPAAFYYITLQFIPRWARALLFLAGGMGITLLALYRLLRSLKSILLLPQPKTTRSLPAMAAVPPQGPRIVALGGGHGLSTLLRGLKHYTANLVAIVTVADDGGSSGVLRRELGLLPPGDLRDCLSALAEAEPLMAQLLQYRFGRGAGLDGHAFGNVFIAALAGVTGSFERAITQANRVLAVQGRIIPSCLENVVLCAEERDRAHPDQEPRLVYGQAQIAAARGIVERVYLQPNDVRGYPEAIKAILQAEMIVLGPGSLYTSVLPNLLVRDISEAIRASAAIKVYVCNVATQPGETDGYTVGDHYRALSAHLGPGFCHFVLANNNLSYAPPSASGSTLVPPEFVCDDGCCLVLGDLVDPQLPWRHEPDKLAKALQHIYEVHRQQAF